jgi:hypothetical protein
MVCRSETLATAARPDTSFVPAPHTGSQIAPFTVVLHPYSSAQPPPIFHWGVVGISLLAPTLGGSTSIAALAPLWILMGCLLVTSPSLPLHRPRLFLLAAVALAAASLSTFLPLLSTPPEWRTTLLQNGLALTNSVSPQPALSAEAFIVAAAGTIWTLLLTSLQWTDRERRRALQIYTLGICALCLLSIASHSLGFTPWLWPSGTFGFFPNRNQTANVVALAGIVAFGLGLERFLVGSQSGTTRELHPLPSALPSATFPTRSASALWLISLPIFLKTLILCNSRAGVCILLGGCFAILVRCAITSHSRKASALSVSIVCLLISGLLLFGGPLLKRLCSGTEYSSDLRLKLQSDTLHLCSGSPILGIGLGNFGSVFAMYRSNSVAQNIAVHPESDWLWAAAEIGWPTTLLLAGAALWGLIRAFYDSHKDPLRTTTAVASAAFLLHSFVDVPAHRFGSLLPALLLYSLSLPLLPAPPTKTLCSSGFTFLRWNGWGLLAAGLLALTESLAIRLPRSTPLPTEGLPWALPSQRLERLQIRLKNATEIEDFDQLADLAGKALKIAPLDWELLFLRASARLSGSREESDVSEILGDFTLARLLQPHLVAPCMEEARLWLLIGQTQLAFHAWEEVLRRAPLSDTPLPSLFQTMLSDVGPRKDLRRQIRSQVGSNKDLLIAFLRNASVEEWQEETLQLLEEDPTLRSLSSFQRRALFSLWEERYDRTKLVPLLQAHPELLPEGWRSAALLAVGRGAFQEACELASKYAPRPSFPPLTPDQSLQALERQFSRQPQNLLTGIQLVRAQTAAGAQRDALRTLARIRQLPGAPSYLAFEQATLLTALKEWEQAWQIWKTATD